MKVRCLGGPLSGRLHELEPGQSRIEYVQLHTELFVGNEVEAFAPSDPILHESKYYDVFQRFDGTYFAVEEVVAKEIRSMQSRHDNRIQIARSKVLALVGLD